MYRDDIPSPASVDPRVMRDNDTCVGQAMAGEHNIHYHAPSMADLHAKSADHHGEMVDKNIKASKFFMAHPEFDEFIQLIRQGAIQI